MSQFSDDFSDGNLTAGTVWEGDITEFTVNENFQLQLDAIDPGISTLYTNVSFPDSVRWKGYALYDFAPSNNNNGAIYLAIDNPDIASANGYILRFGENGSDDALNFIRLDVGEETILASGSIGALGGDPAEFTYTITLDASGIWTAEIAYNSGAPMLEFTVLEETYPMSSLSYFGIEALYTSSNVDHVFYDDLIVEEDLPDTDPPEVVDINVIDESEIQIIFDEAMDVATLNNPDNYFISPGNPIPSQIITDEQVPTQVILMYDPPLIGSTAYTILVSGCTDLAGNLMADAMTEFFIPDTPEVGDLQVSEILFDPFQDQSDFVEIYNSSDKILSLDGVFIENQDKDERDLIITSALMLPRTYLAITDDTTGLIETYNPPDTANYVQQSIPSFNNADGNFSIGLVTQSGEVILESFDYEEDFHFSLIDDTEGVSLGRISFNVDENDPDNWRSGVESTNFATPGYASGSTIDFSNPSGDFVTLESEVFSPNGDGDKELLTILFDVPKEGFVASVRIFDYRGQEVRLLTNNQLIASQDFLFWDGLTDDGRRANIGPYIIYVSAFHPDGDVLDKKMPAVLADFLD